MFVCSSVLAHQTILAHQMALTHLSLPLAPPRRIECTGRDCHCYGLDTVLSDFSSVHIVVPVTEKT